MPPEIGDASDVLEFQNANTDRETPLPMTGSNPSTDQAESGSDPMA
jgi:hypothetical protein